MTAHNLVEQLILWRSGHHVRDVMVGGRWRVVDGVVEHLDHARARARLHEEAARLWARST